MENLASLLDDVQLVNLEILELIHLPAEPANLDEINFLCLVEAEVHAEIVL